MSETFSNIVRSKKPAAPVAELRVEVIADLICPFCYLGKRRLDDAMRAVQGPSAVSWYPYQLNPDMPAAGMGFEEYLRHRFGDPANIEPVLNELAREGLREGILFRFDKLEHVPNTLPVHQLMHFAEASGKNQTALAEDLMSAFFERGENIGDRDVLVELSRPHGLGAAEVAQAVEDEHTRQIVLSREAQARATGMSGVPGFLVNRRLLVIGAQGQESLVSAFDRAMFGEGSDPLVSPTLH